MITWLVTIALMGLITYGILVVVRVLDRLFNKVAAWVQQKIRERRGKVFAGKLSRILQAAAENQQEMPTLDLSQFTDPEQTIVTVSTNENGQIENAGDDIQVLDVSALNPTDARDATLVAALDRSAVTVLNA